MRVTRVSEHTSHITTPFALTRTPTAPISQPRGHTSDMAAGQHSRGNTTPVPSHTSQRFLLVSLETRPIGSATRCPGHCCRTTAVVPAHAAPGLQGSPDLCLPPSHDTPSTFSAKPKVKKKHVKLLMAVPKGTISEDNINRESQHKFSSHKLFPRG